VPEIRLNEPEIDASLQHMGGPGMPQRVHGRMCVDAAVCEGFPERALHTAPGHGGGSGRPRVPTTAWCREDQDWMTVRDPILAKPGQRPVRQGDIPIFPARTRTDVDQQTSASDIGPLQMGPLLKPETTGGDRGEAHAVARQSHAVETPAHLFEPEDHRQLFLAWRSHTTPGGPVAVEGLLDAEREAAQRDGARTAGVLLDMLDGEEVLAACFLTEHVW
jgi:hypothetical protein